MTQVSKIAQQPASIADVRLLHDPQADGNGRLDNVVRRNRSSGLLVYTELLDSPGALMSDIKPLAGRVDDEATWNCAPRRNPTAKP